MTDHGDVVDQQLRALLEANRTIVGDLDLELVLRRVVESALALVGATYGALAVVGEYGAVEEFVHVGMPDDAVEAIGQLPEGRGLLGLVIERQQAIRVDDLTTHPASVGFPPGHPPMRAFLGVPVRVRGEAYGHLYLTRTDAEAFTEQDEELMQALAATAGVAIENARLHDQLQGLRVLEDQERIRADGRVYLTPEPKDVVVMVCGGTGGLHAAVVHSFGTSLTQTVAIV